MAWPVPLAKIGSIIITVVRSMPKNAWPQVAEYLGKILKLAPGVAKKMNPVSLLTNVYRTAGSVSKMLALLFKAMCACGQVYFAVEIFNMARSIIPDDAVDALLSIFREEGVDVHKVDQNGDIVIDVTPEKPIAELGSQVAMVPSHRPMSEVIPYRVSPDERASVKSRNASPLARAHAVKQDALRGAISALGSYDSFVRLREALRVCDDQFLADYDCLRGR